MAEAGAGDSSSPETDRDFEPSAELLVHDYDDEGTMEEEENLSGASGDNEELDDLQKEGDMPLEEVLAMYGYGPNNEGVGSETNYSCDSNSEEDILNNHDLTLDKDQVARDVLGHTDSSLSPALDTLSENIGPSVTSHLINGSYADEDGSYDADDIDYNPLFEEVWKKSIQVGEEFQATIPMMINDATKVASCATSTAEERKVWDPTILPETEVIQYLRELQASETSDSARLPDKVIVRDNEQALYTLLQSDFNIEEAVRRKQLQTAPPTDPLSLWSEEECQNFESGLRVYGKNFFAIHQHKIQTRSVGELVQFYYFWKRTERREAFCSRGRLERKRLATPGITDYADRFMDRQDSEDESGQSLPIECSCSSPDPLSTSFSPNTNTDSLSSKLDKTEDTLTSSTNRVADVSSADNPNGNSNEKRRLSEDISKEMTYNNDSSLPLGSSPKRLRTEPTATPVSN
ncbi:mesoderm induction early response protein 1-like [Watersipora subatra]|uniref:mesoderm induction early response protein 1-like n=1 Tax=Watersipora subatra TaxID=2589382 RepID=UPI00355C1933